MTNACRTSARLAALCVPLLLTLSVSRPADARRCPNVMFVVDRSGSMDEDPNGGGAKPSKWDLLRTAITNVVGKYGARLAFGLEMFTSNGGGNSCYTDTMIDVQVAHGSGPMIVQTLNANEPLGGTNTSEAIKRAYTDGTLNDKSRGNYIVLVTDGDPNCDANEPQATYNEITNATQLVPPIHTFVVGFDGAGGGVFPMKLNLMAQAGLEPQPGCDVNNAAKPCYYSASTPQKFLDAMDKIIGGLAGGTVVGGCDDSCFSNPCPGGQVCLIPSPGLDPVCKPDLCANVTCDQAAYCKNGTCTSPCPTCDAGQVCVSGTCVADPCANIKCPMNQVCDPKQMKCVADKCAGQMLNCPLPTFCDPLTGTCADDACRLINCPANSTCYNGSCMIDPPEMAPPDMAMDVPEDLSVGQIVFPDLATQQMGRTQTGSCQIGGDGGAGTTLAGALPIGLALAALMIRRRRRAAR